MGGVGGWVWVGGCGWGWVVWVGVGGGGWCGWGWVVWVVMGGVGGWVWVGVGVGGCGLVWVGGYKCPSRCLSASVCQIVSLSVGQSLI